MSGDLCIYCLAPGCVDDVAQHRPDCPQVTGWYPVTSVEVAEQIVCMDCGDAFRVGETYVQRPESEYEETRAFPCYELVCVGCAFLPRKAAS